MSENRYPLEIFNIDPLLEDFRGDLDYRNQRYYEIKEELTEGGSLTDFANAHHYYGFHKDKDGWVYREWAPAADALYLIGEFNQWNKDSHPLNRVDFNTWEIRLKPEELHHGDLVKVRVEFQGRSQDRIPIYIKRAIQNPRTNDFSGQIWEPSNKFIWSDEGFKGLDGEAPFIYETHVGMAQEKEESGLIVNLQIIF